MEKTGGQAFPVVNKIYVGEGEYNSEVEYGMTLRDYFAGQFLAGYGTSYGIVNDYDVAAKCYEIADAMIAQREAK